jgi:CubicO group peptidase (beta-lactamase class C family)
VDPAAIRDFVAALDATGESHSVMVLRRGAVIAEGWWAPYASGLRHQLFSVSKSVTSAAVGLAVGEGRFGYDDAVIDLLPEDAPTEPDDHLRAMTVRHLLTMSTGHDAESLPHTFRHGPGWARSILARPVPYRPGTHFLYDTGATYLLSAIVQRTTGERLSDYLRPRLFAPLGIVDPPWERSDDDVDTGGYGLSLTTEELARFTELLRRRGEWHGRQLLDPAWVDQASAFQVDNDRPETEPDWCQGYGWQLWRCRHHAYRGDGAFGQFALVLPEQEVTVITTSGTFAMQRILDAVWEHLLPGIDREPAASAGDDAALGELLDGLRLVPLGAASDGEADRVLGGFRLGTPVQGIDRVAIAAADGGWSIEVGSGPLAQRIPVGRGAWAEGSLTLPTGHTSRTAASGAPSDDGGLEVRVALTETPFIATLRIAPTAEGVRIAASVNVTFAPTGDLGVHEGVREG